MKKIAIALLMVFGFYMCTRNQTNSITNITSKLDKSTGFVDLALSIVDKKETDSTYQYLAQALYDKDTVGIEISLKKNLNQDSIKKQSLNNCISFHSIGSKSDKLLTSMAKLYETAYVPLSFRKDEVKFTSISLNNNPVDYEKGSYTFKILMQENEISPELYVNFDFTNNQIQFNEKDVEFRKSILTYLASKSSAVLGDGRTAMK